jgi:hypothetical protein
MYINKNNNGSNNTNMPYISCAERQRRKGDAKKPKGDMRQELTSSCTVRQRPKGDMREELTSSCTVRQHWKGGVKKRPKGDMRQELTSSDVKSIDKLLRYALLLVDLNKAIKGLSLNLNQVSFVVDHSNQTWFIKLVAIFKDVYPDMHITLVVSHSGSLTIKGTFDDIRLVVPDGQLSQIGEHEDPLIAQCLEVIHGPVVLVSGDGKMKPGHNHIYDAVCKRIQRGLITFILARKGSISKELKVLEGVFPGLLNIVKADLGNAKKAR